RRLDFERRIAPGGAPGADPARGSLRRADHLTLVRLVVDGIRVRHRQLPRQAPGALIDCQARPTPKPVLSLDGAGRFAGRCWALRWTVLGASLDGAGCFAGRCWRFAGRCWRFAVGCWTLPRDGRSEIAVTD